MTAIDDDDEDADAVPAIASVIVIVVERHRHPPWASVYVQSNIWPYAVALETVSQMSDGFLLSLSEWLSLLMLHLHSLADL